MCKSKMKTHATEPIHVQPQTPRRSNSNKSSKSHRTPQTNVNSTSHPSTCSNFTNSSLCSYISNVSNISSTLSKESLSSLRSSLPENPHVYDFAEICMATNNFLSKRFSSGWRCVIRGKEVVIFQRKFRRKIDPKTLKERLSVICRSHHVSIVKLLGAALSGDHIYLVYEYVNGGSLSDCLRNAKNPGFTVLKTWIGRMQVATDLAQALEYIHHYTGLLGVCHVHNHIKSSSVLVTEPEFNAKVCHFGTAELCGEIAEEGEGKVVEGEGDRKLKRSDSRAMKFEGARGYMPPEFQFGGSATQKSDVFTFGVVILELLSGEEPLKYKIDKDSGNYRRVSLIKTVAEAMEEGKLRQWIDSRLRDSYPVDVAEKMTQVALDCVHADPEKRPDMKRVAGKVSKLYLHSRKWVETMQVPTDFTVSFAPR